VVVTADGKRIVTGSLDGTARVWDANTGAELVILKGQASQVWSVAVTPDGNRIVIVSNDKTARVWDANTGAELLTLKGNDTSSFYSVAVTPDGERIVTGSFDETGRVWERPLSRGQGQQGRRRCGLPKGARTPRRPGLRSRQLSEIRQSQGARASRRVGCINAPCCRALISVT
jgi:WD40 repeat protein